MARREAADYGDEVLVEMLAGGGKTYGQIGEAPKGSYPQKWPRTDEVEAKNDPSPAESEVSGEQAVAEGETPAEGQGKDRGTPEGQIRTCAL